MSENVLYYGDNLDVLRRHVRDETVDLVYLDPPFKSNWDYNVLFAEHSGERSASQIRAFEDTWQWDLGAEAAYREVVESGGKVADALRALRTFLGESDMMAYLAMMAPRLAELRRVLKATGSLYLHCDPAASHYLKMLLDAVFGPQGFRNEITWKRTSAHANVGRRFAVVKDSLLFYSRSQEWTWNQPYIAYSPEYVESHYGQTEAGTGRRFTTRDLTASVQRASKGQLYEWRGFRPPETRVWAYTKDKMEEFDHDGRLVHSPRGMPRLKLYLDEMPGTPCDDVWVDIPPINSQAEERLGYPTQKPEALLERVIRASSDEGDTVLDPFCGCGTAVAVAQQMRRRWIGIDITHLAVGLIKHRLRHAARLEPGTGYRVVGEPTDLAGAATLGAEDPYQFQWWALGQVGARPVEQRQGADRGVDGRLYFHDDATGGSTKQIILSVKAGHVSVPHLRDLRGVLDREGAEIGVLLCMEEPTQPMRTEAASAGFYLSPWGTKHPRLQILTIAEILGGKRIDYPADRQTNVTFRRAPEAAAAVAEGPDLFGSSGSQPPEDGGNDDTAESDEEPASKPPRHPSSPRRKKRQP